MLGGLVMLILAMVVLGKFIEGTNKLFDNDLAGCLIVLCGVLAFLGWFVYYAATHWN